MTKREKKIRPPRITVYTRKGRKTVKPETMTPAAEPGEKSTPKRRAPATSPAAEPIPMGD
jgi:hypothetical protein